MFAVRPIFVPAEKELALPFSPLHTLIVPAVTGLAVAFAAAAPAAAQGWPERTVTIVVPFAPGGSSDLLGRLFADQLSQQTGQTFIVENRPGAAGTLGTSEVARSAADGHTLIQVTAGTIALTPALMGDAPYDTLADFAPIAFVASEPNVLLIDPSIPAESFDEFVEYLRNAPEPVPYGSAGPGTPAHLGMELLVAAKGLDMIHVPYRGAAPAVADVAAGHVAAVFPTRASALAQIETGAVRMLAVTGDERLASAPDVPTVNELGLPELNVPIWYGYFAPAGTPEEVQVRLHEEFTAALADPEFVARLETLGLVPKSPDQDLADAVAFVEATLEEARFIVETTGITLE